MKKTFKDGLTDAAAKITEARIVLESLRDEAAENYDRKSDKWKETEAGEAASTFNDSLVELADGAEEIENKITDLLSADE